MEETPHRVGAPPANQLNTDPDSIGKCQAIRKLEMAGFGRIWQDLSVKMKQCVFFALNDRKKTVEEYEKILGI